MANSPNFIQVKLGPMTFTVVTSSPLSPEQVVALGPVVAAMETEMHHFEAPAERPVASDPATSEGEARK